MRIIISIGIAEKIINIVTIGPMGSNNCPMNHGKNIPPIPLPIRNQLVILGVRRIRSEARTKVVGNIEANDNPRPMVPSQSIVFDMGQMIIIPMLAKPPSRSM